MTSNVDAIANPKAKIPFSPYQTAIFDAIQDNTQDVIVNAVAGSGKTTTIVEASNLIPTSRTAVFCAFNKSIVDELSERLGGNVTCKTINAIGHGALAKYLGRVKLDDGKYRDIIAQVTEFVVHDDMKAFQSGIASLVSFAQSTLSETTDDAFAELAAQYGIELATTKDFDAEYFYDAARYVLKTGAEMAESEKVISFNDQIWLPNLWNLPCTKYDYVFVDEVQDLSRGKLGIVLRSRAYGGRVIGVGDPRQSIYGFAGADPRAWNEIIERTNAKVLPLSVCYRCPRSVVELAKAIVPEIEAHTNAADGHVETISQDKLINEAAIGDIVLCRYTAPLIRTCLQFIKEQKPARVKGRDLAKQLLGMAREALRYGTWEEFPKALDALVALKVGQLKGRKNTENQIQSLQDRAEGLLACFDAFNARSINEFASQVEGLFSDAGGVIELSTIHRAKGLEANRIFILSPSKLGTGGKLPWEQEQERNLKYVALTRAKTHLYFVSEKKG